MSTKLPRKMRRNGQEGIALLMVMSSVAILSFLLGTFTYDTKVNKVRIYNQIDKVQARLNAESGIKFALAKLKLYQEAINLLEKNDQAKKNFSPRKLESLITQPFVFPLSADLLKDANLIQKSAAKAFTDSIVLDGKLLVTMQSVSGFLNPNNLRFVPKDEENEEEEESNEEEDKEKKPPHAVIEKQFLDVITDALEKKREEDDAFDAQYGNIDPTMLVKELKFFVNDPKNVDDPEIPDISQKYEEKGVKPKHAPMTSLSEMYLLEGWDDALVDLIIGRLTVHAVTIIPVNEITEEQLRVLFPAITKVQVEEFFKFRDGDQVNGIEANEFKDAEDFKDAILKLGISDEQSYQERIKEFESAGIRIGVAGKLFKVESRGEKGASSYTLTAYIDLPVLPPPPKKKKKKDDKKPEDPEKPDDPESKNDPDDDDEEKDKDKKTPMELMPPRVVELIIGKER